MKLWITPRAIVSGFCLVVTLLMTGGGMSSAGSVEGHSAVSSEPTQAGAAPGRYLDIVLLGDSYSAGNGARDEDGNRSYVGPDGCFRSLDNWAWKYVRYLRSQGSHVSFVNHACSGATTGNVHGGNEVKGRQVVMRPPPAMVDESSEVLPWAVANHACDTGSYPDEVTFEPSQPAAYTRDYVLGDSISFHCRRYLVPQNTFIGAKTDLVLMTLGGNDLEFEDIVKQCFAPGWRDGATCEGLITEAVNNMPRLEERLRGTIIGLYTSGGPDGEGLSPNARVVLLGYPLLAMEDVPYEVDDYHAAYHVRKLGELGEETLRKVVRSINAGSSAAAGKVRFVPGVPTHFASHEPDPDANRENPRGWLFELGQTKMIEEWYHSNPTGHEEYMDSLSASGADGFGAGVNRRPPGDVDVVFAVDVSESMAGELAAVRSQMDRILAAAAGRANTARFAVVSFREDPRFSGDPADFTSRVEQDFTADPSLVTAAVRRLAAAGGGGSRETMLSGVMTGLELPWRTGVKKSVIVVSDNWPHDPERFTGLNAGAIVNRAWSVDPAAVSIVDTGNVAVNPTAQRIVRETAGVIETVASEDEAPLALERALEVTLTRPHAWINGPYVTRIGKGIELDGSGSYSTDDTELVSYQWDFDGDRRPDQVTTGPLVTHAWDEEFTGPVGLTVTDTTGRVSVATAYVAVTSDGDEVPTAFDNCPAVDNMGQSDVDGDGVGDVCDPTPGWTIPEDPVQTKPSRLDGIPRPGNTLTADPGEWNYPATYTFQWLFDGADIPGATAPTHPVQAGEVGHWIGVRIIAKIEDFGTVRTETLESVIEPEPLTMVSPSTVVGAPRAGRTLTAIPSQWSGPTTATYQWLRDGNLIAGATEPTYQPGRHDVRRRVTVQITTTAEHLGIVSVDRHDYRIRRYASRTGLRLKTRSSSPGTVIAKIRITTPAPHLPKGRIRILDGNHLIATPLTRDGTVTVLLRGLATGDHRIRAQYLGNRLTGRSHSSWRYVFIRWP